MSKRDQIEQALLGMDGGRFQKLGDAYLRKLGHHGVNPLGRSLGSDKASKGTPDTWIAQPDGKFIFAEYTTTPRAKLPKKLHDDLDKCLDERKTGIPVSHIRQIFLVHTSVLSPADERALLEKGEEHGVLVSTIGLGPLTQDLHEKYPALALEYLGIEVDTGQVLSHDNFIEAYGVNELATPLDTVFVGRASDVEDVRAKLESGNLVVVSGRAGVGKTRFVLECFRLFTEAHAEWTIRGILNRNRDLFNDLRAHLTPPGKYLVLVDDANRVSGFDYVLQTLHERKSGIELKVVATVRDYARDKVRQATRPYGGAVEIELTPLTTEEIHEIVRTKYGILNSLYLDRIADIAKGNPRLAMMAGRVAAEENTLFSIQDVTSLYDRYYESVRAELGGAFGDRTLLRVAGIISLLRVVDKCHSEQMAQISHSFGISADAFWEAAQRLHEMELVDMYEDEVVRISDQVLATYLFYLATFVERGILDPGVLIYEYFPAQRYRLMDAFYGVLNAFDTERIIGQLRPHVQRAVEEAEAAGDEDKILHLVDAFWFTSPTDALVVIQHRLVLMETEPRQEPLHLDPQKAQGSIPEASVLHALGRFRHAGDSRRVALDLLLDYAAKRPSDLPHVIDHLVGRYGFRHTSHMEGFQVEQDVVDALGERMRGDSDELFVRIFCGVAKDFLRTRFHVSESHDERFLRLYDGELTADVDVSVLRAKIWNHLVALARGGHRALVLGVLHSHAKDWHDVTVPEIVANDAAHVLPFIESDLDPRSFEDCVLANAYMDLLDRRKVPYPEHLRARFRSELYVLSELLDPGWDKRMELGHENFAEWWNGRIAEHFAAASAEDYTQFFAQAAFLVGATADDGKTAQLKFAVEGVLAELSARKPELFVHVLDEYLAAGNPLALGRQRLPAALIRQVGPDLAFEILTTHEYFGRRLWLFDFYQVLPAKNINAERLEQLFVLFREAEPYEYPYSWDFLNEYSSVDSQVFIHVAEILVEKGKSQPAVGRAFVSLFNSYEGLAGELPTLFAGREDLIEKAYLLMQFDQPHSDYDGAVFNLLLNLNPGFGTTYVDWVFDRHVESQPYPTAPDPHHEHRRYEFIWRRDDYASVMQGVVQRVYELETSRFAFRSYVSVFFTVYGDDKEGERSRDPVVLSRQDEVLAELIEHRAGEIDFVSWLFETISSFSPERRARLLSTFLANNQNVDDFKRLSLDPKEWSAWGSLVPVYQKRVEVLESFLPLVTGSARLLHRKRIEDEIEEYRRMIEREKKRDFMGD